MQSVDSNIAVKLSCGHLDVHPLICQITLHQSRVVVVLTTKLENS